MKKIILVEDDPSIQDSFSLVFTPPEYSITCYNNGEPLLSNKYELPDLFIIDKQLSGVDGLDLCRHLKNNLHTKQIPVIIISATPSIINLAKAAGADNALVKPYRLAELRQMVNKYL